MEVSYQPFNLEGNCSITKFFNNSQSSFEQKNVRNGQGSQSGIASYLITNQVEMPAEQIDTNNSGCSTDNMPQGRQAWSYNVDEIDPSIIDELPPEIQN
ncbi:DNA polymerase eta-like, partial [Trifolium medium]|nr:DNA polymerase eta-like [Trifolium medium]